MENLKIIKTYLFLLMFLTAVTASSQVVFGDTYIDNGAIFQLTSTDKGLMIPKVALTSRTDITTITPSLVEGLWVYNTANAGSGLDTVSPGFYFWDSNGIWVKIYNEGYTVQFEQTVTERSANTTTTYTLPGLDQNVVAPYTGTYEIHVTGYIAAANYDDSGYEAMVHGELSLEIDNTKVAGSHVSSNTKAVPSAFQALGRQTTIVYYVDLSAGQSYNFKVRGRLWQQVNVDDASLDVSGVCGGPSSGYAFWGICSGPYNGNDGLTDNAQDAYCCLMRVNVIVPL